MRSLTAENATLQQRIDDRSRQIGEAGNADWLEEQARRLGFVFPGETLYIITTPGVGIPAGGGVNATLPTFVPAPTPSPTPSPSPSPTATPQPSPTPVTFALPSPTPH